MISKHGLFHQMFLCSVIITVLGLMCGGCVVNHPEAYTSKPDYNNRIDVSGAHYKRKMTATGYTMLGVATVGGAVAGWFVPMVSYYDGAEQKNLAPVNAAIGAVAGFGTSYFISRIMGWGKTRPVKDPKKWMQKSNPQYIVFEEQDKNRFRIIHRSAEQNYTVKNMADVEDYRLAFPNTDQYDNVVKQSVSAVKRDELLKVLSYYPQSRYAIDVKRKYVETSPTVSELFTAYDKYPETKVDVEKLAVSLVSNCGDAMRYQARFPESSNLKRVLLNGIGQCNSNQLDQVRSSFGSAFQIDMEDVLDLAPTAAQIRSYTNILFETTAPGALNDAARFYTKHHWLRYPDVKQDIMRNLWGVNTNVNSSLPRKRQQEEFRKALSIVSKSK